jgi:hypothetical protein
LKHTKGPWYSDGSSVFTVNDAYYVAETQLKLHSFTHLGEEAKANARLIACAPEMLDMLELLSECESYSELEMFLEKTKQIVKKAKGES